MGISKVSTGVTTETNRSFKIDSRQKLRLMTNCEHSYAPVNPSASSCGSGEDLAIVVFVHILMINYYNPKFLERPPIGTLRDVGKKRAAMTEND